MSENLDVSERKGSAGIGTRVFAFATLAILVSGVGYVGREAYRAYNDSFVAPAILSPDNDMVLQNKLRMSELAVERSKSHAELDAVDEDITAYTKGIEKLETLLATANKGLDWTTKLNEGQAYAGSVELKTLARQHDALSEVYAAQKQTVATAEANLAAGVISKMDYAKETQALTQLQVALLENDRSRTQAEMLQKQVAMAKRSLDGAGSMPMPEQIMQQDQVARVELELLKLQSEKRKAVAMRSVISEKLAKIDELESQLKGRPQFRAAEENLDLAFVPYSQIEGVSQGAAVYDCVWGVFACEKVGTVAEVVPGEVILPDPWGTQTRGQFAVMNLGKRDAAKSKILRIRPLPGSHPSSATPASQVAVK